MRRTTTSCNLIASKLSQVGKVSENSLFSVNLYILITNITPTPPTVIEILSYKNVLFHQLLEILPKMSSHQLGLFILSTFLCFD